MASGDIEEKLAQARESIIADNNIQTRVDSSMRSWMKKVSAPFDRKTAYVRHP